MLKDNKIKILPRTILGKWSLVLIIIFIFLFIINIIIIKLLVNPSDSQKEQTLFNNPIGISMLVVATSGILSFFTGITSIIWKRERSILVFLSTLIGLLILWFMIGEILIPH